MAEFPALPVFTDAYLADTRHLTTLEHGAYLLLLMEAWRRPNTALPNDDEVLAKLAGLLASEWHTIKPKILSFWSLDNRNQTWTQKRLTKQKEYVKNTSKKQRSNSKSRWDKEKDVSHGNAKQDAKPHAKEMPTPMPNASQTDASISISITTDKDSNAREGFDQIWATLSAIPGVKGTRLARNQDISKILPLLKQGYDLHSHVIPAIKDVLSRPNVEPPGSWNYFISAIVQAAQREAIINMPDTAKIKSPNDWQERLDWARQNAKWWDGWGNPPNTPGCLVPPALLKPTDGQNWGKHDG